MAVLISRLRSVLGRERIQRRDGGYVLVCDWLDASELAALTEEMDRRRAAGNLLGAAAAARVALSLLRGYEPPQVPGEWAQLRLAELDRLAGRARQVGAAVLLEAGDWMAAADVATVAVEADGYDEASLRVLLRAYVAGGRVAAALAAYAQARERLAAELGTDPSPETVALYTAILRGELPAPAAAAARGPAGLVARDEELAYLDTIAGRARDGSTEIVVVDGDAGIGKTALLRAWAAQREGAGDVVLAAACGPARPLHATGCPAVRAVRIAAPPRSRRRRRPARPGRADAGAPARRRSAVLPGRTDPGRQHARPGGAVRGAGAGAGAAGGPGPAGRGDR